MSTRILANEDEDRGETGAILFEGTSGRAYGHVFDDYEQADAFVRWVTDEVGVDPCRLSQIEYDTRRTKFLNLWRTCGLTEEEYSTMTKLEVWVFTTNSEPGHQGRQQVHALYGKRGEARRELFRIE
jgi:hypothetical protein